MEDLTASTVTTGFYREGLLNPEAAESILFSIYYYPIDLDTIAQIIEAMREVCEMYSPSGAVDWIKRMKQLDPRFRVLED